MLHSEWKLIFLLLFFLFLPFCQPMGYHSLTTGQSTGILSTAKNYPRAQGLPSRVGEESFVNPFTSTQLDLVFVLDTSPNMESFYTENLFGVNFLDRFQDYDWKFAYTDMSVSIDKRNPHKKQTVEDNSCSNAAWSVGGIGTLLALIPIGGIAGPMLMASGISMGAKCGSKKEKIDENNLANGVFRPFEYKGKEFKSKGIHQLTKNVKNYNQIFDHSLRNGNKKNHSGDCFFQRECDRYSFSGKVSYDAPRTIYNIAYPLLSTLISLERGNQSIVVEGNMESFFRKDSVIVYVLVTVHDIDDSIDLKVDKFRNSIKKALGHENRMKLIPVTLSSESNYICNVSVDDFTAPSKLKRFAKQLGNTPIDICSQNLADELFLEIEKSLYKKNILNQ